MARRLEPYLVASPAAAVAQEPEHLLDEHSERAMTLVTVMPPHQQRATIERLTCPDDPELAHRAVDALIESALVVEDGRGRLHLR